MNGGEGKAGGYAKGRVKLPRSGLVLYRNFEIAELRYSMIGNISIVRSQKIPDKLSLKF
jgi:hypothetical protein